MASTIDVITRAREHAAKSGFVWEQMEPEQMGKFIRRAVRDFQGPTIVFPGWVDSPTRCLMRTYSTIEIDRHGIIIRHLSVEAGASWYDATFDDTIGSWSK